VGREIEDWLERRKGAFGGVFNEKDQATLKTPRLFSLYSPVPNLGYSFAVLSFRHIFLVLLSEREEESKIGRRRGFLSMSLVSSIAHPSLIID